jgi:hypothetical protein
MAACLCFIRIVVCFVGIATWWSVLPVHALFAWFTQAIGGIRA